MKNTAFLGILLPITNELAFRGCIPQDSIVPVDTTDTADPQDNERIHVQTSEKEDE